MDLISAYRAAASRVEDTTLSDECETKARDLLFSLGENVLAMPVSREADILHKVEVLADFLAREWDGPLEAGLHRIAAEARRFTA